MNNTIPARLKAIFLLMSTVQLVEAFEATENDHRPEIPTARGWMMDELEKRNAGAFDAWLEASPAVGSPRQFFIK